MIPHEPTRLHSAGALTRLCFMALTVSASYSSPLFLSYRGGANRASSPSIIPDPLILSEPWYQRFIHQQRNRSMMGPIACSPSVTPLPELQKVSSTPSLDALHSIIRLSPEPSEPNSTTVKRDIKKAFTRLGEGYYY